MEVLVDPLSAQFLLELRLNDLPKRLADTTLAFKKLFAFRDNAVNIALSGCPVVVLALVIGD